MGVTIRLKYHCHLKVFSIICEFRILRLTFHRKSASKYWIKELIICFWFIISLSKDIDHLNLKLWIVRGHTASLRLEFWNVRILEFLNITHEYLFFRPACHNMLIYINWCVFLVKGWLWDVLPQKFGHRALWLLSSIHPSVHQSSFSCTCFCNVTSDWIMSKICYSIFCEILSEIFWRH